MERRCSVRVTARRQLLHRLRRLENERRALLARFPELKGVRFEVKRARMELRPSSTASTNVGTLLHPVH